MYYFKHPDTKEGYDLALTEWMLLRDKLDGQRPHATIYHDHIDLFSQIVDYYNQFGTPKDEQPLRRQVEAFIEWINELLKEPTLEPNMRVNRFLLGGKNKAFAEEFDFEAYRSLGGPHYELPAKWIDRLGRMHGKKSDKLPQTIDYWVKAYLDSVKDRGGRSISKKSSHDRQYKLKPFKNYADLQAHVSTIDDDYLAAYHRHIDDLNLAKETKKDYFSVFKMFVMWSARNKKCDLTKPAMLDSKEFTFREPKGTGRKRLEKKLLLWSPDEVKKALALPKPYNCYVVLMLNCGFRHIDISELRHTDIDWQQQRIIIQRHKTNQDAAAPVISYKIWNTTADLIQECMSDPDKDDIVFRNSRGNQVERTIPQWWDDHRAKHGLDGKRLDYLRKTGSSFIDRECHHDLSELYLGHNLSSTASIAYNFNDGSPNSHLDSAIDQLGQAFGFVEKIETQTVELTPAQIKHLQALGVI